jgi:hypothetical protein
MRKFFHLLAALAMGCSLRAAQINVSIYGSDTGGVGDGTTVDGSNGSGHKPYRTIQKALNVAAAGDVIRVGPGIFREACTLSTAGTWASDVKLWADPQNTQGFKDGSGNLVPPDYVTWTAFTTSDTTTGAASPGLAGAAKGHIWIEGFVCIPSASNPFFSFNVSQGSKNVTIKNNNIQAIASGGYAIAFNIAFGDVIHLLVDGNVITGVGNSSANCISLLYDSSNSGADWDPDIIIRNNKMLCFGYTCLGVAKSGGLTHVMGGLQIYNNFIAGTTGFWTANMSTSIKTTLLNNIVWGVNPLIADSASQLAIDYNYSGPGNSGVTDGAHDHHGDWSHKIELGQSEQFGFGARDWFSVIKGSPFDGGGTNVLSTDILGATRPNPNSLGPSEPRKAPTRITSN